MNNVPDVFLPLLNSICPPEGPMKRKQDTCRCARLAFPHRREWTCDAFADHALKPDRCGVSQDVIDADNAERARDCNAVVRGGYR